MFSECEGYIFHKLIEDTSSAYNRNGVIPYFFYLYSIFMNNASKFDFQRFTDGIVLQDVFYFVRISSYLLEFPLVKKLTYQRENPLA